MCKYIHDICIHILKDLVSLYAYYVYVRVYIYIIKAYMHWEDKNPERPPSPNCLVIITL